jgi:NAD(P)-dependent dehydrogenase (short-subunit alcohol dehydrogenase family)
MEIDQCLNPGLLRDKAVFITGGGSGICLAIAHGFARVGANVAICGRTRERLTTATEGLRKHGGTVVSTVADGHDGDQVDAALAIAREHLGPVSTGSAARPATSSPRPKSSVRTGSAPWWRSTWWAASTPRAPRSSSCARRRATSCSCLRASPNSRICSKHVGAAKAGIDSLMRHLAVEWGPLGIRSHSIVPGPISGTEGMKRLAETIGEQTWIDGIPLGRFGNAEEVAAMAVVLSPPLASSSPERG